MVGDRILDTCTRLGSVPARSVSGIAGRWAGGDQSYLQPQRCLAVFQTYHIRAPLDTMHSSPPHHQSCWDRQYPNTHWTIEARIGEKPRRGPVWWSSDWVAVAGGGVLCRELGEL